ncbi:serine/threonine-protein kinase [Pseudomonas zeae]|uniref:Serine/threonine-protein kinase n=1 Tax=Pseudomonas zeae TaxID=2745510 RepID=A0ABU5BNN1_9PSED|nr:serine/threonine-protein kinase [Pseudomonas zeae]MDX9678239.1 serine/threonine-protein kinase [Pseudomonas zeae]
MRIADRYDFGGESLAGGMAKVLICNDITLERKVAIKVMPGSSNKRRVRDELNALLKMRSKHVVQVYDILTIEREDLAIVQEFIEGLDLFDPKTRPENSEDYLKLIWQIASGLSDIHQLNVIHRDIKPNNMKIDAEGIVKIFDFGLSRDEGENAETVGFIGTRGFAAPELYAHDAKFTKAVDTYAFGATALYIGLYDLPAELRTQPPKALEDEYFSQFSFELSDDVKKILSSCLDLNPNNRPSIKNIRDTLALHLLQNRHKALVVHNKKPSYLHANNRSVVLSLPNLGAVEIHYNGFDFSVKNVSGEVFINNKKVTIGSKLPGACVVALGSSAHGSKREYITFDLSHPEIVL